MISQCCRSAIRQDNIPIYFRAHSGVLELFKSVLFLASALRFWQSLFVPCTSRFLLTLSEASTIIRNSTSFFIDHNCLISETNPSYFSKFNPFLSLTYQMGMIYLWSSLVSFLSQLRECWLLASSSLSHDPTTSQNPIKSLHYHCWWWLRFYIRSNISLCQVHTCCKVSTGTFLWFCRNKLLYSFWVSSEHWLVICHLVWVSSS